MHYTLNMPRPPSDNTIQIAVRVPPEWLDRASEIAKRLSHPPAEVSRTGVLRAAIEIGLVALEKRATTKKGSRT